MIDCRGMTKRDRLAAIRTMLTKVQVPESRGSTTNHQGYQHTARGNPSFILEIRKRAAVHVRANFSSKQSNMYLGLTETVVIRDMSDRRK